MASFRVGDVIKIELEESFLEKEQFECAIIEVLPDTLVLNHVDISPYYFQYLYEGREIKFFSYGLNGIDIYDSMILNSPLDGIFEIELPLISKKIQRRQYLRADAKLKVNLVDKKARFAGETINLSENAMKILSSIPIKLNNEYFFEIFLDKTTCILVKGKVLKVIKEKRTEYVIEYVDIGSKERDKILKFCLTEQSKLINIRKSCL